MATDPEPQQSNAELYQLPPRYIFIFVSIVCCNPQASGLRLNRPTVQGLPCLLCLVLRPHALRSPRPPPAPGPQAQLRERLSFGLAHHLRPRTHRELRPILYHITHPLVPARGSKPVSSPNTSVRRPRRPHTNHARPPEGRASSAGISDLRLRSLGIHEARPTYPLPITKRELGTTPTSAVPLRLGWHVFNLELRISSVSRPIFICNSPSILCSCTPRRPHSLLRRLKLEAGPGCSFRHMMPQRLNSKVVANLLV
ncbi:hypothetical protein C8Q74DRAFT_851346 [Fomes fomentarius]|nr:hypothetical protein C8Q74DRAFT_851346 [Fomes fomentarius]